MNYYLIGIAVLLVVSVVTSKATSRYGVPSLLVFLALGMLAGSEGIGQIYFNNAFQAQTIGIICLVYILFSGGIDTNLKEVRPVFLQGFLLSTFGVLITCGLTGLFLKTFLHFTWIEGLLLGAIVSSTDAAAVFSVLRGRGIGFTGKVKPLLEFESGINDPVAVLLTVALLQVLTHQMESPLHLVFDLLKHLVLGAVIGIGAGKGMGALLNKVKLEFEGLYPVMSLALVLLIYAFTEVMGGSGFLAVYLTGLVLSNENFVRKKSLILFHDGIAWLMQITMFLCLGLLVYPSQLIPVAVDGLLISAFLILIARPAAVFLSLMKTSFTTRQKLMISWVGLRGSVPIILATYPMIAGVVNADGIFNLVFFIVFTSVLLQGTTISWVAKLLKVNARNVPKFRFPIEYNATGDLKSDLVEIEIKPQSPGVGKSIIGLNLPKDALVVLIQRQGNVIVPKGGTILESKDTMLILAENAAIEEIRNTIGS